MRHGRKPAASRKNKETRYILLEFNIVNKNGIKIKKISANQQLEVISFIEKAVQENFSGDDEGQVFGTNFPDASTVVVDMGVAGDTRQSDEEIGKTIERDSLSTEQLPKGMVLEFEGVVETTSTKKKSVSPAKKKGKKTITPETSELFFMIVDAKKYEEGQISVTREKLIAKKRDELSRLVREKLGIGLNIVNFEGNVITINLEENIGEEREGKLGKKIEKYVNSELGNDSTIKLYSYLLKDNSPKTKETVLEFLILGGNNKPIGKTDKESKKEIYEVINGIVRAKEVSIDGTNLSIVVSDIADVNTLGNHIVDAFDEEMGRTEGGFTLVYKEHTTKKKGKKTITPTKKTKKEITLSYVRETVVLKFMIVDILEKEKVTSFDKGTKDNIYHLLSEISNDIVDRSIRGNVLTIEIVRDEKSETKIARDIEKKFKTDPNHGIVLVYKGDFTQKQKQVKKKVSPTKYKKGEPVYELNVMQSSLPREVYMVPLSYFEKNKKVETLLHKHMDVDADVDDTTWAEFHSAVSRKLHLDMDSEFRPYIFKDGGTYTIEQMWWIDYE